MEEHVRIRSAIKIRIGEAKSLSSKSCRILPGCPNTFCVVILDKEELFETEVVEKTPCPFFCEQFEFEIPRAFWTVGFYLISTDTSPLSTNTPIGKVSFTKDQLSSLPSKDQWHVLKTVKYSSDAQGKANISTKMLGDHSNTYLHVRVKECCNLYISDTKKVIPYAILQIVDNVNSVRSRRQQTGPLRKCKNMQWKDAVFEFKLDDHLKKVDNDLSRLFLKADFYHYNGMFRESVFLGEIYTSLHNTTTTWSDTWYFLCPMVTENSVHPNPDLGSLRLQIEYKEDHILPTHCYLPLLDLLQNSLNDMENSVVYITGTLFNEQLINLAQCLVRIFLHLNKVEDFLLCLTEIDMTRTSNPNTLFRANSLATKGIDELMKTIGRDYLSSVLKPTLDKIHRENLHCEIDPARLGSLDTLKNNLNNLNLNIKSVFNAIISSSPRCPRMLSYLFHKLQQQALQYFPDVPDVRYTSVSGFIFLRLFAPAILNPKLFKLQDKRPNLRTSRTLTLVSKVIQSLGNLDTHQAGKEKYMENISRKVLDVDHVNGVKKFLEEISDPSDKSREDEKGTPIKEGILTEYTRSSIPGRDFNKRKKFYRLNDSVLIAQRNGENWFINNEDIQLAARVDENSFGIDHVFQIIHKRGTLYLRAQNSVEHYDWIRCLSRVISRDPIMSYHSGILYNGKWSCCMASKHETTGCRNNVNINIPCIDIERELQRFYTIVSCGMDKLTDHVTAIQDEIDARGRDEQNGSHELKKALDSTRNLIAIMGDLEEKHQQYRRIKSAGTRHLPVAACTLNNT